MRNWTDGVKESTEVTRVMYRCRPCKQAERLTYQTLVRVETSTARQPHGYEYPCSTTKRRYAPTLPWGWMPERQCPDCGRTMGFAVIEGTVNAAVPCNAKCMNAIGPSCDCACGGVHHGGRHDR